MPEIERAETKEEILERAERRLKELGQVWEEFKEELLGKGEIQGNLALLGDIEDSTRNEIEKAEKEGRDPQLGPNQEIFRAIFDKHAEVIRERDEALSAIGEKNENFSQGDYFEKIKRI